MMSEEEKINEIAATLGATVEQHTKWVWECIDFLESPIERIFFTTFQVTFTILGSSIFAAKTDESERDIRERYPKWTVIVRPQKNIERYRVDFLINVHLDDGSVRGIVVECDGHDFHEKTKEQAAKDKSRDRVLQSLGYQVFRFTGSEIYRAPIDAAHEIVVHIQKLLRQSGG